MHEGHRDRLRERFLSEGLDGFEPHNVLELLLFYTIPQKDTNEIAHRLINSFGSLKGVFDAPVDELTAISGISKNGAVLIKMIPSICRLYMDHDGSGFVFDSTEKSGEFLLNKYIGRTDEMVSIICMDNACRFLNWDIISHGSVNAAAVNTRKIVEVALRYNATCIILAHNHPNGIAIPSMQDISTTNRLTESLEAVGIHLLDHIVIGGNDFISITDSKKHGKMISMENEIVEEK